MRPQYLSPHKLKELIRHYSEFVTHPVSLRQIKTEMVPVEKEESEEDGEDEKKEETEDGDDDIEVTDEDEDEKEPEMQEITTFEYEQINTDPAIWARDKDEITDEEYKEFFEVVNHGDSMGGAEDWTHFNAE